ncbi:ABC transporter substrate-binding protein [Streptomyces daliensis]
MALLAAGCGGVGGGGDDGAGGKVTIRYAWWGDATRAEMIKKSIALFEKEHPGINVKPEFQEYEDFWKKFATQASGGGAPDVFQNAAAFMRKYGDRKTLLDLSSQVDKGNLDMKGFRAGLEKAGEVDGKLWGVPVGANTFSLIYDVEAFERIGVEPGMGWTWDDYEKAVDKLKAEGFQATTPAGVMYHYDLLLRQQGKQFFTEDGQLGFGKADLTAHWKEQYAGIEDGRFVPQKKADQIAPKALLSAGFSKSEYQWDNFIVRFSAEAEEEGKFALAPLPTTDGKKTGQYLSSLFLSGYAKTRHPEEVAKFIDFMVHDPEVGKIMGYNRGILATEEQYDAFEPTGPDKMIAEYEEKVEKAGVIEPMTPQPDGTDVVEAALLRIWQDVAHGKKSVDEGVDQFFSEAEQALGS